MCDTHPLWRPYDPPTPEEIARARVAPAETVAVEVVAPDPGWPAQFLEVRSRIAAALGRRALAIEHVGSTSVPGLGAKPLIDVNLTVADSADEPARPRGGRLRAARPRAGVGAAPHASR